MKPEVYCKLCNQPIPAARLAALPAAKTCVQCSQTGRVAGFAIISGKTTYSELQIVPQDLANELYEKQDRKGAGVASGVQFKQLPTPRLSNLEFDEGKPGTKFPDQKERQKKLDGGE